MPGVQITRAKTSDAPALSAIALAAKAHWGYPAHWLEHWRELLTITPDFIATNETFSGQIDQRIIGFYALIAAPGTISLEHLWVLPEAMGKGVGRSLFADAVERAASLGARSLTIEADPNAEAFYRHLGAVRIGSVATEIDGRPRHLPLLAYDLTRRVNY